MKEFMTSEDDPKAKALEKRWNNCSDTAHFFAAHNCGLWPGVLPHVLAEIWDFIESGKFPLTPTVESTLKL